MRSRLRRDFPRGPPRLRLEFPGSAWPTSRCLVLVFPATPRCNGAAINWGVISRALSRPWHEAPCGEPAVVGEISAVFTHAVGEVGRVEPRIGPEPMTCRLRTEDRAEEGHTPTISDAPSSRSPEPLTGAPPRSGFG